ncbi:MAG TPA: hypothetical protein PK239_15890 [Chitinophagales bacterium]|nr:hypothetical protein [Chitinophagales bacterium]
MPQPFTHKGTGCGGAAFFQQFWRLYHSTPKHRESGKQAPFAFLNCYYIYPDTKHSPLFTTYYQPDFVSHKDKYIQISSYFLVAATEYHRHRCAVPYLLPCGGKQTY